MTTRDADSESSPRGHASGGRWTGHARVKPRTSPVEIDDDASGNALVAAPTAPPPAVTIPPTTPGGSATPPTPPTPPGSPPATPPTPPTPPAHPGPPAIPPPDISSRTPPTPPPGLPPEGPTSASGGGPAPGRHRAPDDETYAWFPTTYAEIDAMLRTGKCPKRVALVPLDVIERIREMMHGPSGSLAAKQQDLAESHTRLKKRMGKGYTGPFAHTLRVAWRATAMTLGTALWLGPILPATLTVIAGLVGGVSWLYMHQQLLRKWRVYDDNRVLGAIKQRKKRLRTKMVKPLTERPMRVLAWTLLAAFSPIGFTCETVARVFRNAQIRVAKRSVERKRDNLENSAKVLKEKVEKLAKRERRSALLEVPADIVPTPAAYDTLHHERQKAPQTVTPSSTENLVAEFEDPDKRRRGSGRGSLV